MAAMSLALNSSQACARFNEKVMTESLCPFVFPTTKTHKIDFWCVFRENFDMDGLLMCCHGVLAVLLLC